jgi:D-alanyl-D-alanine carboxypeptidase/D-alanyl-D-alanine-endopeptidase (penicillin-binding protein 4)
MFRRLTLPVVLMLTMCISGFEAWHTDRASVVALAGADANAPSPAVTPMLSVRRAPVWLQRPKADAALTTALDAIMTASPPDTCLVVRDNGRVLYSRNATMPVVPASTVKLLTAFASTQQLGKDATFDTVAVAASAPQAGVLTGNLWVVGGGDPILSTKDYVDLYEEPEPFTNVATLVDHLVAAGVTQIRGDIIGDESRYDARRYVSTWDPSFIADHESGPLSALAMNDGFSVYPKSKLSGGPVVPAADPAQQAATVIRDQLVQRGIKVTGAARSGRAPAGVVEVARVTATLHDVVIEMLGQSDNYTAESLTKEMGVKVSGAGTTVAGVAAARDALAQAGLPLDNVSIVDGSGLDRSNRLTCTLLTAILDRIGASSDIANALPVAAKTGTLAERFVGSVAAGRIRAKTGSLRNSRALAGFADSGASTDQHTLTFAYIANQNNLDTVANLKVQDQLGAGLVAYPQGPTLAQLAPQ